VTPAILDEDRRTGLRSPCDHVAYLVAAIRAGEEPRGASCRSGGSSSPATATDAGRPDAGADRDRRHTSSRSAAAALHSIRRSSSPDAPGITASPTTRTGDSSLVPALANASNWRASLTNATALRDEALARVISPLRIESGSLPECRSYSSSSVRSVGRRDPRRVECRRRTGRG
jgi:hypothetical protein